MLLHFSLSGNPTSTLRALCLWVCVCVCGTAGAFCFIFAQRRLQTTQFSTKNKSFYPPVFCIPYQTILFSSVLYIVGL